MTDPREKPLIDAARKVTLDTNYDPHFSSLEDRLMMETKLFLARMDALAKSEVGTPRPIDMILFCPKCGVQHIDGPEGEHGTNPPHRSHLCHYCKHVWRPADVPTNGVKEIRTKGERDMPPVRGVADRLARFYRQWPEGAFEERAGEPE
jgi:hypothetical protein